MLPSSLCISDGLAFVEQAMEEAMGEEEVSPFDSFGLLTADIIMLFRRWRWRWRLVRRVEF